MGHAWLYPGQLPAVHFLTVGQRPRSPHAGAPGTLGVVDVSATGPPPLPRLRAGEHRSLIHAFCVFPNEGDASLAVNHLLAWRMPARMGRDKVKMHPCGLEPPARRRAFPEGRKRAPTALRRSFTGSCWPRRLLSVTTFRADVAPPHVGSPGVHARVAGMAKMGGSLPAVALSSREARGTAPCNAPRSVRPVFPGAALVGWCQTMNMTMRACPAGPGCVWTARAPISLHLLRAANPRASSLSFICPMGS